MKKGENLVTLLVIAGCLYGAVQTGSLLGQWLVIRDGSTTGGGKMKKPVDIFWFGESGPVWVEAAQTMERAKACVDALPLKTSGGLRGSGSPHRQQHVFRTKLKGWSPQCVAN
jgi:hypothetical protein